MNDIHPETFFNRMGWKLKSSFLSVVWRKARIVQYLLFCDFVKQANIMERRINAFRKKRNELELVKDREPEHYHEIKGFVDAIDWILKGDWK